MKHSLIPATLHFQKPNPEIEFEESPFYVNTELKEWKTAGQPRRAGVSSFGVGGTNAHLVLEEAPAVEKPRSRERSWELLLWSARSEAALEQMTGNLQKYLQQNEGAVDLGDVAYTLQVGRKTFPHRRFAVCRSVGEAAKALGGGEGESLYTSQQEGQNRPVVFLFPGQGSQYAGMGKDLYEEEEVFREEVDRCSEWLKQELGLDLREVLYGEDEKQLQQTWLTQPALFVTEYALARQWMAWGVKPAGMLGHSVGEYVAACLAGVFSVEEGLRLVAARGRLMQKMPCGRMLAVGVGESEVEGLRAGVWLASVNGPMQCVLSGEAEALEEVAKELEEGGVNCKWLETSHAFHSGMMEGALEEFREQVRRVKLKGPQAPFLSNVTGTWITAKEAQEAEYWVKHLRATVRFSDGVRELLQDPQRIFLEVGPGQALTRLVRQQRGLAEKHRLFSSLPMAEAGVSTAPGVLGSLWLEGASINWALFHSSHARRRVPLPTYPFERQRYWIEPKTQLSAEQSSNVGLEKHEEAGARPQETQKAPKPASRSTARLHERPQLETPYVPPTSELEATIAGICQDALSIVQIGIDDNFFALGGDSLIALHVIAEMKEKLQVDVAVASLYEHLTVRSLAAMLSHNRREEELTLNRDDGRAEIMLRRRNHQLMERRKRAGRQLAS